MLHYLIHTCSWAQLRQVCRQLEATVERELAEGLETGVLSVKLVCDAGCAVGLLSKISM